MKNNIELCNLFEQVDMLLTRDNNPNDGGEEN